MVPLYEMLLTPKRGGRPGLPLRPGYIVLHWTANRNAGANAVANRHYFDRNPNLKVGAHYIVDDHQIVRCVPENEVAYHGGGERYTPLAVKLFGGSPNGQTVGIEMCVNADGDFKKTYRNLVELTADIMGRHGWGADVLLRHYDITGKDCPRFWVHDATAREFGFASAKMAWEQFKADATQQMGVKPIGDWENMWATEGIKYVTGKGLMSLNSEGQFEPDKAVTRAMLATVLHRLAQKA